VTLLVLLGHLLLWRNTQLDYEQLRVDSVSYRFVFQLNVGQDKEVEGRLIVWMHWVQQCDHIHIFMKSL
jgi:hypothetical protein